MVKKIRRPSIGPRIVTGLERLLVASERMYFDHMPWDTVTFKDSYCSDQEEFEAVRAACRYLTHLIKWFDNK